MPPPTPILPNIHKIAVVRANALGDLIFALPALTALRESYPAAEIVYIGKPLHQTFFAGRPGPVDRVVVAPISRGVRYDPGDVEDRAALPPFFERMQAEKFDLALQLHGGGRNSNPFVLKLGARHTAGTRTPDAPMLDFWLPYVYYQREYLRWLEVAALVGATTDRIAPEVTVIESDLIEAMAVLPEPDRPFAVLHPGSTDLRRQWPPERFAQVGDVLAARGLSVYVTGVASEADLVESVIGQMRRPAHNLCGKLSIGGLIGLLSLSSLLISNDTGPLHLSAAVGSSTIGLYWGPNLINGGPMTRRDHRPQLSWMLECPLCGVDMMREDATEIGVAQFNCEHRTSFVAKVSVEDVLAAMDELLDQNGTRRPAVYCDEVRRRSGIVSQPVR